MVHLSAVALLERIDSINQSVRQSVYSSRFMTASFVFLNLVKFDCSFNTCIFKENNCFQSNHGPFSPISFQKKMREVVIELSRKFLCLSSYPVCGLSLCMICVKK